MVSEGVLVGFRVQSTESISESKAPHDSVESSCPSRAMLKGEAVRTPGVNSRMQSVVAVGKQEDVDPIREVNFGRRRRVRKEGGKGLVETFVGCSLLPVRGGVCMETNEEGVTPVDAHANHQSPPPRVSVKESVLRRRHPRRDPEAEATSSVTGHSRRRSVGCVGREGRAAPRGVPSAGLGGRPTTSLAEQQDVSGGLSAVKIGPTGSLITEAPDVMETITHRVGSALDRFHPRPTIPLQVDPRAEKKGEDIKS